MSLIKVLPHKFETLNAIAVVVAVVAAILIAVIALKFKTVLSFKKR